MSTQPDSGAGADGIAFAVDVINEVCDNLFADEDAALTAMIAALADRLMRRACDREHGRAAVAMVGAFLGELAALAFERLHAER